MIRRLFDEVSDTERPGDLKENFFRHDAVFSSDYSGVDSFAW
jgi:hypothetical protein